jgi:hypothetical protein
MDLAEYQHNTCMRRCTEVNERAEDEDAALLDTESHWFGILTKINRMAGPI